LLPKKLALPPRELLPLGTPTRLLLPPTLLFLPFISLFIFSGPLLSRH
jgi:hypothetical protein